MERSRDDGEGDARMELALKETENERTFERNKTNTKRTQMRELRGWNRCKLETQLPVVATVSTEVYTTINNNSHQSTNYEFIHAIFTNNQAKNKLKERL